MTAPMNRQAKRMMAKQGTDKPRAPERKAPAAQPTKERTGPRQYLREVRGELKKVAWPTRSEVINSSIIVIIGVVVMATIIFGFDYGSLKFVDWIFG
jgi:preprotein translocase subunit SecE